MGCEDIRELLEAYVLDALNADEKARVDQHLIDCDECRELSYQLADAAGAIPQALAAASPLRLHPSVKERLFRSLEAQVGSESATEPHTANSNGLLDSPATSRTKARPLYLQLRTLAWVAALILLIISTFWSVRLGGALAQERALRAEFAGLVDQQELVLEVVDSSRTVKRILRSPQAGVQSYGKLYTRTDMTHVVAMAARLEQPPMNEAYHFWLVQGDQTSLAGTMQVNDEGFGLLVLEANVMGPVYDSAFLTLQNEGDTQPLDSRVLVWAASP